MKEYIIRLGKNLLIPFCTLMIAYCIFYQSLVSFSYIYIIRYILFGLGLLLCLSWIMDMLDNSKKETKKTSFKNKRIIETLYLKVGYIINYFFSIYFFIYLVFKLDKKSLLYNYLMLFLFGLFLGYRIAIKAYRYLKANQEKD
jgi:hypothetical protein